MTKLTTLTAAFFAAGLIASAGAASAQSPAEDIMIVRVSDLNTSSSRGAEIALRRIKAASTAFCGGPSREIRQDREQKQCAKRMTDQAVRELNAPLVTAKHRPLQPVELAQSAPWAR